MEGKGTLRVTTTLVGAEEDSIRIEISDTGPGIPEQILPHIFEPFYTTKEEGRGTGLGLSLAYGIIENHQGTISVQSQVNQGTTFYIRLPLKRHDQKGESRGRADGHPSDTGS
jgi:signal transduction histidine kinase